MSLPSVHMEFMFSLIVGELCFFTINEKSGRIVLSNEKLFLLAFLPRLDEGTLNWEKWESEGSQRARKLAGSKKRSELQHVSNLLFKKIIIFIFGYTASPLLCFL